ncbi:MAG: hypothetical protein LQ345_007321 [Seirophora villosa]|nr:MAG: hypothetical protein LQ345_007321 [Seirophora villosa]
MSQAELRQRLEELTLSTAPLPLLPLLKKCHEAFVDNLDIEFDPKKSTTGATTSVTKKLRPKSLKPWIGFPELRQNTFDQADALLRALSEEEQRCFNTPSEIKGIASANRKVSCETDLRIYHHLSVEHFVSKIVKRLIQIPEARSKLHLGADMTLENHTHCLTINLQEDVKADKDDPESAHHQSKDYRPKDTDQLCLKHSDGERIAVAIFEMKPPHKATTQLLTAGLHPIDDIGSEVINRKTNKSLKNQDRFQQSADKFVSMIITQIYSYMVRAGIGYGAIITGQAMVFVQVRRAEPLTVYFYHADPRAEVEDELQTRGSFPYECTAIAQLTAFCLMAHGCKEYSQQWRQGVDKEGLRWEFHDKIPEQDIPLDVATYSERPHSAFTPRRQTTLWYQSPVVPHSKPSESPKPSTPAKYGCKPAGSSVKKGPNDDDSSDEFDPKDTPTRNQSRPQDARRQSQGRSRETKQPPPPTSRGSAHGYAYCSHGCLKGLVERAALDTSCPNFALHPQHPTSDRHAITRPLLARLLRQQLAVDLDNYCIDLRKHGRTGMLFKITLLSHGYTFVAKGTGKGFILSAKHEGRVYSLMKERQGKTIPVYLGNIDLLQKWIGGNFDVVHMLLMSWAGESVAQNIARDTPGQYLVRQHKEEFEHQCMMMGIHHRDTEYRNILWNEETKQILFVDFDMTVLFNLSRPPPDTAESELYQEVFGSPKETVALEYVTIQEELELADQKTKPSMQTEDVSTGISNSGYPNKSNATSPLKEVAKAMAFGTTNGPSWLSVNEQNAVSRSDAALVVSTNMSVTRQLERTDKKSSSLLLNKILYPVKAKPSNDTTPAKIDHDWRIHTEDNDKKDAAPSQPSLVSSSTKNSQRPSRKSSSESYDEEDKENAPVDQFP